MSIKKYILFLFIEFLIFLFSVQLFSKNVEIKFSGVLGFFDKTDINGTSEKEKARYEIKRDIRI